MIHYIFHRNVFFAVCTVVFFKIGVRFHEIEEDFDVAYFRLPDGCSDEDPHVNASHIQYGHDNLHAIQEDLHIPYITYLSDQDTMSMDSWIRGEDQIATVRLDDYWYISQNTDMGGVSGEEFRDWWEGVNCSDRYRWWHPRDHMYGVWVDFLETEPVSDLVILAGRLHRAKEKIKNVVRYMDVIFVDPCVGRDCEALRSEGVEAILSAQIYSYIPFFGRVRTVTFTNTFVVNETGNTLHSRFVIGRNIHCLDDHLYPWGCYFLEKFPWLTKRVLLSDDVIESIYKHCKEETFLLSRLIERMRPDKRGQNNSEPVQVP